MTTQTPQEKPTTAYIISLISGILGIISSAVLLIIALTVFRITFTLTVIPFIIYAVLGAYGLITSSLIVWASTELNNNSREHSKWGTIILVLSIIGFGGWLGIIGGILALIWNPNPTTHYTSYTAQSPIGTKVCLKCSRVIGEQYKFCPYCGAAVTQN